MTKRTRKQEKQREAAICYNKCYRKSSYNTELEAFHYAKLTLSYHPNQHLEPYYCNVCNKFHLTSK